MWLEIRKFAPTRLHEQANFRIATLVTGIVTMRGTRFPLSFSRPLRETFVCRRPPGR